MCWGTLMDTVQWGFGTSEREGRFFCSLVFKEPHQELFYVYLLHWSSQVVLVVKNLPAKAGDISDGGSVPGLGRFPGEGNGNPFQYSCLENPMDRGAWWLQKVGQDWSNLAHVSLTLLNSFCLALWILINFVNFWTKESILLFMQVGSNMQSGTSV